MTINPVDMQVMVPQVGQISRINRTQENQQQTEQQILGQLIQEEMKRKEIIIDELQQMEQKKVKLDDKEEGKGQHTKGQGQPKQGEEEVEKEAGSKEKVGRLFDIKI